MKKINFVNAIVKKAAHILIGTQEYEVIDETYENEDDLIPTSAETLNKLQENMEEVAVPTRRHNRTNTSKSKQCR